MSPMKKNCCTQGIQLIAGVDEVGRGPALAGPVVAAAILPKNCKIPGFKTIARKFLNLSTGLFTKQFWIRLFRLVLG